jgi:hypothetical protein
MRLIDDDGKALIAEIGNPVDDEGEFLDRRDDDLLAVL